MRRLLLVVLALTASFAVTLVTADAITRVDRERVTLTRSGRDVYRDDGYGVVRYYLTRHCSAPAIRAKVVLDGDANLHFPTGEACYAHAIIIWNTEPVRGIQTARVEG